MLVRPREAADEPAVVALLAANHSDRVARLGRIERPIEHPALIAERESRLAGAVDDARARLKPEIPELGSYGIPIRDELVLERSLGDPWLA